MATSKIGPSSGSQTITIEPEVRTLTLRLRARASETTGSSSGDPEMPGGGSQVLSQPTPSDGFGVSQTPSLPSQDEIRLLRLKRFDPKAYASEMAKLSPPASSPGTETTQTPQAQTSQAQTSQTQTPQTGTSQTATSPTLKLRTPQPGTALRTAGGPGGGEPNPGGGASTVFDENQDPEMTLALVTRQEMIRREMDASAAERAARVKRFQQAQLALSLKSPGELSGQVSHDEFAQKQINFASAVFKMHLAQAQLAAKQKAMGEQMGPTFGQAQNRMLASFGTMLAKHKTLMNAHDSIQQARLALLAKTAKDLTGEQGKAKHDAILEKAQMQKNFGDAWFKMNLAQGMLLKGQKDRAERVGPTPNQALKLLMANPPRPLLQGPVVNNVIQKKGYFINAKQAKHVVHGDAKGGMHAGQYNALKGKGPDAVTKQVIGAHKITHFPQAWDHDDILSALQEAAAATYNLAYQQANYLWKHPPVQVTRRGITIWVVVITNNALMVWTGYPL
jgi:hypothetical protein